MGALLGFPNGKNLPVARLNVTSKKSVSIRLVYIMIVRVLKNSNDVFPFFIELLALLIAVIPHY